MLAVPAVAQTVNLKQELRTKEASASKDPDALFQVAKWANEKGLVADAKRLYQAVLKLKPDHQDANLAVGNSLVEGKWLAPKEAEAARKKALAAEYSAKGFVEVSGVWVEKDKVDDAKRGVFHHEGERVTKEEKLALMSGKVRHPETGEIIDATHLEKAKNKYFPIGSEGRWVDEKEADTYHSDVGRPWLIRSKHCTVMSTLPLAKVLAFKEHVDRGYEMVQPLLGFAEVTPPNRPVILVAASRSEFQEFGKEIGDETSSHGAFLADAGRLMPIPMQGEVRVAVCDNDKDWGTRFARHAAGIAYVSGIAADHGADLPLWFVHGFGSFAARFENDSDAGWFGKQHEAKGGVRNLKGFFSSFAINMEMESKTIDYNIFQAGLLLAYATKGGDAKVTETMQAVTASFADSKKSGVDKAIGKLQAALIDAEPKIVAYLKQLIAKAPS
ncbi:MAG TPA: hypothetical protein VF384_13235 [Planctomycetota bacterium]